MANTINHAEKYERELIATYVDESYVPQFVATNTEWLDAKNFHFTNLIVGGYGKWSHKG